MKDSRIPILLLRVSMNKRKNFFENYRQFGHALSKDSPALLVALNITLDLLVTLDDLVYGNTNNMRPVYLYISCTPGQHGTNKF
jgi:hypothetical protein